MARVLRQTTVVRDEMHNALTDLMFWQDCYWVSYHKGNSHSSCDGEACLSVSVVRQRFREAARLKVPGDEYSLASTFRESWIEEDQRKSSS